MESYSLANSVYCADELINQEALIEAKVAGFYASDYSIGQINEYTSLVCEGNLLLEFSIKAFVEDNIVNLFQAGIGFALEAGITVGSFGVGAPAAAGAEMINDMVFFGYSGADALLTIKNLFTSVGDLGMAVKKMFISTVKDTPQKIYDRVQKVINKLGAMLKKISKSIKKGINKLKEIYRKLMTKMAKVIGDCVGIFSPLPGTDIIVQNAIAEFADDAFKFIVKGFDKLPKFVTKFINNPELMKTEVFSVLDACIKFIEKGIGNAEESESEQKSFFTSVFDGAASAVSAVANPLSTMLKYSGAGQKLIDWIKKEAKGLISTAMNAYAKIYPVMMTAASALTILVNDDHDLFKKKGVKKKAGVPTSESFIREEIGRNFRTMDNNPYSWKDNKELDIESYANLDGTWQAKVSSLINPEWSTPYITFKDEYSASAWIAKCVDILTRKQLSMKEPVVQIASYE